MLLQDSPLEKSNPIQDVFESPDDIEVGADRAQDVKVGDTKFKDTPHKGKQGKAKPKKVGSITWVRVVHLLVNSIFSFCLNVFYSSKQKFIILATFNFRLLILSIWSSPKFCPKLTLSQTSPCSISLLKTQSKKDKLLVTSSFPFSHSVFYPLGKFSAIFINFEIVVCKLLQFGRVLKLSFGKELILEILITDSDWFL